MLNAGVLRFEVGGRIEATEATPTEYNAAIGSRDALISVAFDVPPDHSSSRLPFTADNRVCVEEAPWHHFAPSGLPITESGAVAVNTTDPVDHWLVGLPFTADSRLALVPADVPPVNLHAFTSAFDQGAFA